MTHFSPLRIWMVAICRERGLPDPENLSEEEARKLKAEFDRQNQPPSETKEPLGEKGVP